MKRILWLTLISFSFCLTAMSQTDVLLHFNVETGAYTRINTPVCIDIEGVSKSDTLGYQLFEKVKGKLNEKQFQIEQDYMSRLWFILDGTTMPGIKREFYLCKNSFRSPGREITADVTNEAIVLKKGGSEILHYQTAMSYPPQGVDTVFKRNGFIHPLFSPSGNVLTRINAPDHYHHLGIWNPWTRVRINDHVTDFWNLYEKQGTVKFAGINSTISGAVYGGFSVKQDHIDFQGMNHNELVMNEVWDVRAWNSEPVTGMKAYLVDLTTSISVAVTSPVVLEAYRYGGGIGFRANEEWTKDNSTVLTSEGKSRIDADGTRARWTDVNGQFLNKGNSGILFFSHPANREHPEPMRVWPVDANNGRGDVYFEFCPIRLKEWVLTPGNVYRLKYRMLIYDGKIDKVTADRLWNDFAYPPKIEILKN